MVRALHGLARAGLRALARNAPAGWARSGDRPTRKVLAAMLEADPQPPTRGRGVRQTNAADCGACVVEAARLVAAPSEAAWALESERGLLCRARIAAEAFGGHSIALAGPPSCSAWQGARRLRAAPPQQALICSICLERSCDEHVALLALALINLIAQGKRC